MTRLNSRTALAFFTVVAAMLATPAQAAKLSVVGAGNLSKPKLSPIEVIPAAQAKFGIGGGALLEFPFTPVFGVEIGGLYVPRKYDIGSNQAGYVRSLNGLEIPVTLKFRLLPVLNVGVGGFYRMAMGDVKYTTPAGASGSETYDSAGLDKSDMGFHGTLGFDMPVGPMMGFVVDGRYQVGIQDQLKPAQTGSTYKFSGIQVLAGLRFTLGR
jgi:hypothetical protein